MTPGADRMSLTSEPGVALDPHQASRAERSTEDRLDTIAWGLVFLLIGAVIWPISPAQYAAVAVIGGLMLGLNGVRVLLGSRPGVFTLALGATAVIAGVGALMGQELDSFALFFLVLGAVLVVIPMARMATAAR